MIVHFAGHGGDGIGPLFTDDDDSVVARDIKNPEQDLLSLLKSYSDSIQMTVFNCCNCAGTAQKTQKYIACTIGPNVDVRDEPAIQFSEEFYHLLCENDTIQRSFNAALRKYNIALYKGETKHYKLFSNSDKKQMNLLSLNPPNKEIVSTVTKDTNFKIDLHIFYPNVKGYPTPNRCDDDLIGAWSESAISIRFRDETKPIHEWHMGEPILSLNEQHQLERKLQEKLKAELMHPTESYSFETFMNELKIPLDVFQQGRLVFLLPTTRTYFYHPKGERFEEQDDKLMVSHKCTGNTVKAEIPFQEPFESITVHTSKDGTRGMIIDDPHLRKIIVNDLDFRVLDLNVDDGKLITFPRVVTYNMGWSSAQKCNKARWETYFRTADEFKVWFLPQLEKFHDFGWRVAYFENLDGDFCYLFDDNTLHNLTDRGKDWIAKHGIDIKALENDLEHDDACETCSRHNICRLDWDKCMLNVDYQEKRWVGLHDQLLTDKVEEEYVNMIKDLNYSRPKGTHFTEIYTLNADKYPRGWCEEAWNQGEEYWLGLAIEDPNNAQLQYHWPHYTRYFLQAMK